MRGGFLLYRNFAAASSLEKNFVRLREVCVRLRAFKILLLEEFFAAGKIILQGLRGCNRGRQLMCEGEKSPAEGKNSNLAYKQM